MRKEHGPISIISLSIVKHFGESRGIIFLDEYTDDYGEEGDLVYVFAVLVTSGDFAPQVFTRKFPPVEGGEKP